MIKEIIQTTKDKRFTYISMAATDSMLTPMMTFVDPDTFVDDDFDEEYSLTTKLVEACKAAGNVETLPNDRPVPSGPYKYEYYNSLVEEMELLATATVYKNTKLLAPNFVLMSSDLLPIFAFSKDFIRRAPLPEISGTYVAGTYKTISVLVSPILDRGEMIWGVNNTMTPGIITFINEEDKICSKIVNPNTLLLMKLKD